MGDGLMPPCPRIVRGQQKLTPEQEAYAREFAHARIAAQFSPVAISEREAEVHLRAVYRVAKLPPPARIRWFDSPLSFTQACMQYYMQGSVPDCLWKRSWGGYTINFVECRAGERGDMCDRLGRDVLKGVQTIIDAFGRVWSGVENRILSIVQKSVESEMVSDFKNGKWGIVRDGALSRALSNTYRSVWAFSSFRSQVFCRFFHEVFEEQKAIPLARFYEMVSGYSFGRAEAWVVRKPTHMQLDAQGRLHSASGPCIQYRDGWGVYAWHGVHVSEKLIMYPEQIRREDWTGQQNAEVRRAIQERVGNERFVEMVGGRQIDAGRRGKLFEIDLDTHEPERVAHYVQVQDSSTRRQYFLRVPPSITRADEAIAWTFGLAEADYQPGQET